jgi:hypothetical protein
VTNVVHLKSQIWFQVRFIIPQKGVQNFEKIRKCHTLIKHDAIYITAYVPRETHAIKYGELSPRYPAEERLCVTIHTVEKKSVFCLSKGKIVPVLN